MQVYDCFMFFDEIMLLELRLRMLDPYVDYFVISESTYTHSGHRKELLFDKNQFSEFAHKIHYIVVDQPPPDLYTADELLDRPRDKAVLNALKYDNHQRNALMQGLNDAGNDDIIIISDLDEIPNLEGVDFNKIRNRYIIFMQQFFYYKFNLRLDNRPWPGSKACRKKHLKSPQFLRNIKLKRYHPLLRPDTWLNEKKHYSIAIIEHGGWHYTCLKSPEDIDFKLNHFAHHQEYTESKLDTDAINKLIAEKKALWITEMPDTADPSLSTIEWHELPAFIRNNKEKYQAFLA